ncbi:MAG: hypothetical protein JWR63_1179, partial [Conexibacter sp.]|nr:hypothetical protein [Conexibacter sp.]
MPVLLADTRHLLEAIRDTDVDRGCAEIDDRAWKETRARQGVTSDELLQGWRVGLEVVCEEAHARSEELGLADGVLLEFVEAMLRWGDVGVRALVSAHREVEIGVLDRLAEEQAALRRVATVVARGTPAEELFAAVVEEAGRVFPTDIVSLSRRDSGDTITVAAVSGGLADGFPVGGRWPLGGKNIHTVVLETGRSARIDSYADASGRLGIAAREAGAASGVGAPIVIDGRVWGIIGLASTEDPLPADAEARLASFSELLATAIADAASRAGLTRMAEELAALRRVSMLVAREGPPEDVFATVAEEVGRIGGAETAVIHRFDPDGFSTIVAVYGSLQQSFWVGSRWKLEGNSVAATVYRTARPARFDDYPRSAGAIAASAAKLGIRSGVGSPIVVNGRLWGVIAAGTSRAEPLPADSEPRMAEFTELAATAIANVQARSDLAASRARIIATADEERRRVVRDLHDGAQQRLVSTIVTLKLARQALGHDQPDASALMGEALWHAQTANDELRELAHGILPTVLTRGGLHAAVGALASAMSIPVEIDVAVGRLPS